MNKNNKNRCREFSFFLISLISCGQLAASDLAGTELPESTLSRALGGSDQSIVLLQEGEENLAVIQQAGRANSAQAAQLGQKNRIDIEQVGRRNILNVRQENDRNELEISQLGNSNIANIAQMGDAFLSLEQLGDGIEVNITQYKN